MGPSFILLYVKEYKEGFRTKEDIVRYDKFKGTSNTTASDISRFAYDLHIADSLDLVLLHDNEINDDELLKRFPKKVSRCLRGGGSISEIAKRDRIYILLIKRILPEEAEIEQPKQVIERILALAEKDRNYSPQNYEIEYLRQCTEENCFNSDWQEAVKIVIKQNSLGILQGNFIATFTDQLAKAIEQNGSPHIYPLFALLLPLLTNDYKSSTTTLADVRQLTEQFIPFLISKFQSECVPGRIMTESQGEIERFLMAHTKNNKDAQLDVAEKLRHAQLLETREISVRTRDVSHDMQSFENILWKEPKHEFTLLQENKRQVTLELQKLIVEFSSDALLQYDEPAIFFTMTHQHNSKPVTFTGKVIHPERGQNKMGWAMDKSQLGSQNCLKLLWDEWADIKLYHEVSHGFIGIGHKETLIGELSFPPSILAVIMQAEKLPSLTLIIPFAGYSSRKGQIHITVIPLLQ